MYVSLSKLPYRVGAVCGTGCVMHRVFDLGNATQRNGAVSNEIRLVTDVFEVTSVTRTKRSAGRNGTESE